LFVIEGNLTPSITFVLFDKTTLSETIQWRNPPWIFA